jgi:hypothetical protein
LTREEEIILTTKYDLLFESRLTKQETSNEILKDDIKLIKRDLRWII